MYNVQTSFPFRYHLNQLEKKTLKTKQNYIDCIFSSDFSRTPTLEVLLEFLNNSLCDSQVISLFLCLLIKKYVGPKHRIFQPTSLAIRLLQTSLNKMGKMILKVSVPEVVLLTSAVAYSYPSYLEAVLMDRKSRLGILPLDNLLSNYRKCYGENPVKQRKLRENYKCCK